VTTVALRWKPLLAVGLVSGLVQVAAGVTMYLAGVYFTNWGSLASLFFLALCVVAGIWWYGKDVLEGRTTYPLALLVGIVIGVSVGLVYAVYNIVSISFVYPHFIEDLVQNVVQRRLARGMDPQTVPQVTAGLRERMTAGSLAFNNLVTFASLGIILSALTAIWFRRKGAGAHRGSTGRG